MSQMVLIFYELVKNDLRQLNTGKNIQNQKKFCSFLKLFPLLEVMNTFRDHISYITTSSLKVEPPLILGRQKK